MMARVERDEIFINPPRMATLKGPAGAPGFIFPQIATSRPGAIAEKINQK
jgi:hypothetical protein